MDLTGQPWSRPESKENTPDTQSSTRAEQRYGLGRNALTTPKVAELLVGLALDVDAECLDTQIGSDVRHHLRRMRGDLWRLRQ